MCLDWTYFSICILTLSSQSARIHFILQWWGCSSSDEPAISIWFRCWWTKANENCIRGFIWVRCWWVRCWWVENSIIDITNTPEDCQMQEEDLHFAEGFCYRLVEEEILSVFFPGQIGPTLSHHPWDFSSTLEGILNSWRCSHSTVDWSSMRTNLKSK